MKITLLNVLMAGILLLNLTLPVASTPLIKGNWTYR